MNTLSIVLVCVCALLAILFVVTRASIGGYNGLAMKIVASFGFVASAIIAIGLTDSPNTFGMSLITLGLLLGMIGDIVLDLKVIYKESKFYLNAGMLAFGLGHICFFAGLSNIALKTLNSLELPMLVSLGGAIILTCVVILGGTKLMKLNFGNFTWQTILYSFALSFMVIYSLMLMILGGGSVIMFIGLLLFFLSDVVLSTQYFGGKEDSKLLIIINHTLYYAAQILILSYLLFI